MGFWLNPLNKVHGSHKLKILSRFIIRHKTHKLLLTRDFFKLIRFLKKTVANKLLNGTNLQALSETLNVITPNSLSIYSIFQL